MNSHTPNSLSSPRGDALGHTATEQRGLILLFIFFADYLRVLCSNALWCLKTEYRKDPVIWLHSAALKLWHLFMWKERNCCFSGSADCDTEACIKVMRGIPWVSHPLMPVCGCLELRPWKIKPLAECRLCSGAVLAPPHLATANGLVASGFALGHAHCRLRALVWQPTCSLVTVSLMSWVYYKRHGQV